MRGPRHGNGRPHLIGKKNTDPLRKIIAVERDEYDQLVEVLECGHWQPQREDMIGPTNAIRRRCRQCRLLCTATYGDSRCCLPENHAQHLHRSSDGGTWSPIAVGARHERAVKP